MDEGEGAYSADEGNVADFVREKPQGNNPAGGALYPGRNETTTYIGSSLDLPYVLTQGIH